MTSRNNEPKVASINPFGLRMPPELKKQLIQASEANRRSLNQEIVARLQDSLGKPASTAIERADKKKPDTPPVFADLRSMLTEHEKRLTTIEKALKERRFLNVGFKK